MSHEPVERGWWKRLSRTPKLGIAAVGVMVVLPVIILALAGCSTGTVASRVDAAAAAAGSGFSTKAGSAATTLTSRVTTTTGVDRTTTTIADSTTTTGVEATTATSVEATSTTGVKATTTTVAAGLELTIVSVTSPVSAGSSATVKAKTAPGAYCSIEVEYKTGSSTAKGLEPKKADAAGNVSWTWKVGSKTTAGEWPIRVTASLDGQSVLMGTTFVVK
jgi:hypothetical protein